MLSAVVVSTEAKLAGPCLAPSGAGTSTHRKTVTAAARPAAQFRHKREHGADMNSEMCLSARLGTSATLGELDGRQTRRSLLIANMTLLGLQALLISSLAAVISFLLGLITIHRLGDVPAGSGPSNGTVSDPSQSDPWREGTTRPGGAQLVMVLATGMGAAGLSSLALGSFMSSLVVVCRWKGVDPGECAFWSRELLLLTS